MNLFIATTILASRLAARAGADEILMPSYTVRGFVFCEGVRLWDVRWREDGD